MIYLDLDGDEHPFTSYLDVHQGLHRALTVHAPVMAMVGMFVMVVCKKMSSYLWLPSGKLTWLWKITIFTR